MTNQPEFYTTIPISNPVVVPEAEDIQMNGFAWSHEFGLMLAMGDTGGEVLDGLRGLRVPRETFETYGQPTQGA